MTQLDRFKINLPIFPDRFASTARLVENRSLPDIDYNVKSQDPFVAADLKLPRLMKKPQKQLLVKLPHL